VHRLLIIAEHNVLPIYQNFLDSIKSDRNDIAFNRELYDRLRAYNGDYTHDAHSRKDIYLEFEDERDLTMFILRWS